jgi:hypothetical protein
MPKHAVAARLEAVQMESVAALCNKMNQCEHFKHAKIGTTTVTQPKRLTLSLVSGSILRRFVAFIVKEL